MGAHVQNQNAGSRLIIASNRLPVSTDRGPRGEIRVERTVGGLATGLSRPHRETDGLWIGWSGVDRELDADERHAFERLGFAPVTIPKHELQPYYHSIANQCLWPMLHGFVERMHFDDDDWRAYVSVNRGFAERIAEAANVEDLVFIQDFHLALVPAMLRELMPTLRVGFFLHVPFPAPDIFRMFPRRVELLEGLLGADVIGLHTSEYAGNLRGAVQEFLGLTPRGTAVRLGGRRIEFAVEPLGIDTSTFGAPSTAGVEKEFAELREDLGERRLILGVERLDYTKGIPQRMRAFRALLESDPDLVERAVFYQIAVPSREEVDDYATLNDDVTLLVGETNARFGRVGCQPIHYQFRGVERDRLIALYRLADVCLVTPLRDGLNLVAKEYVASRLDNDGVLVLSEFAGVAAELQEAIIVNPFDPTDLSEGIRQALEMPPEERAHRMSSMRQRVEGRTIDGWTDAMLGLIEAARPSGTAASLDDGAAAGLIGRIAAAPTRSIMLDYDGTLREFTGRPEEAIPTAEIVTLVEALQSAPNTQVWIISGRDADFLDQGFRDRRIGLIAEHGAFVRWPSPEGERGRGGDFAELLDLGADVWKAEARTLMRTASQNAPSSEIEEKTIGIAWHYRRCDDGIGERVARTLVRDLGAALAHRGVEIMSGDKVVEVRPRAVSKAKAIQRLVAVQQAEVEGMLIAGDDVTDETMFDEFDGQCPTVLVGDRQTAARYRVQSPSSLRAFLKSLLSALQRPSVEWGEGVVTRT